MQLHVLFKNILIINWRVRNLPHMYFKNIFIVCQTFYVQKNERKTFTCSRRWSACTYSCEWFLSLFKKGEKFYEIKNILQKRFNYHRSNCMRCICVVGKLLKVMRCDDKQCDEHFFPFHVHICISRGAFYNMLCNS